jgi:hypothetical protein
VAGRIEEEILDHYVSESQNTPNETDVGFNVAVNETVFMARFDG